MSIALIDIFNRTGRIVVDATARENFIKTESGKVICIDIGMALQMQQREQLQSLDRKYIRRRSITSLQTWKSLKDAYTPFFKQCALSNPETVNTVKALLFIKINRPDIFDVDFLKNNDKLVKQLSIAYDKQSALYNSSPVVNNALKQLDMYAEKQPKFIEPKDEFAIDSQLDKIDSIVTEHIESNPITEVDEARKELELIRKMTLDNIKESCRVEINRYIKSRGELNIKGKFNPSWVTYLFRNNELTRSKVRGAISLMKEIESTDSLEEINDLLEKCLQNKELVKSAHKSGFESKIKTCLSIVETAKNFQSDLELSAHNSEFNM